MGRKDGLRPGMGFGGHSLPKLLVVLCLGVGAGVALGYIMMGTAHVFMEVGAARHHDEAGAEGESSRSAAAVTAPAGRDTSMDVHVLSTSNGSPYINWQSRIMYGTYLRVLESGAPGAEAMRGFTRILHRSTPDGLEGEIPTFRADPLHPECDKWCLYPVADRPNAVRQFFDAVAQNAAAWNVTAPWLYLTESDYLWLTPLQAPAAGGAGARGLVYKFNYIQPEYNSDSMRSALREMFPESAGPLSAIPQTGPAPALLTLPDWTRVTPTWERLTAHIEASGTTKKTLGWVREMYAFSIALALEKVGVEAKAAPHSPLIAQPPHDSKVGIASALHYTWSSVFKDATGKVVWEFDKRTYVDPAIVRPLKKPNPPPPFQMGWKDAEGKLVSRELYDAVLLTINTMIAGADLMNQRFP